MTSSQAKRLSRFTLLAFVGLLVALIFAGCASTQEQEIESSEPPEQETTPVYVVSKISYGKPVLDDENTVELINTLDDEGNVTQQDIVTDDKTYVSFEQTFDKYGNPATKTVYSRGEKVKTINYTYDLNDDGLPTKATTNDNLDNESFTYEDGRVAKWVSDNSGYSTDLEYDRFGFLTHVELGGNYSYELTYSPEDNAEPATATVSTVDSKTDLDLDFDEYGNLLRISNTNGDMIVEFEYTKIDSPSIRARVFANLMTSDWLAYI